MAFTVTNARAVLDSALKRSGASSGEYSDTERDVAIKTAIHWANEYGVLTRATTDITIPKNTSLVDFSGVTNFDSHNFTDARITDKQTSVVVSGTYIWTLDGGDANAYYLRLTGSLDPGIPEPDQVLGNSLVLAAGTLGSLASSTWSFGDNNSLGYDTLYVQLADDADPSGKANGFVEYMNFDNPVDLVDHDDIKERYDLYGTTLGTPKFIGFQTPTLAEVWPPADDLHVLRTRYKDDVTDWTLGSTSVTLNIPERILMPIIVFGASAIAMGGDPSVFTQSGSWGQFKDWCRLNRSRGIDPGNTVRQAAD